jgi:hypothetical protein
MCCDWSEFYLEPQRWNLLMLLNFKENQSLCPATSMPIMKDAVQRNVHIGEYRGLRKNCSLDVGVTSSPKISLYSSIQGLVLKIFISLDKGKAGFH